MEQNVSESEAEDQEKTGWFTGGNMLGCGCVLLFLLVGSYSIIPFFFPGSFISSGEHLPKAELFSPEATNYSFYCTFMTHVREFNIPEEAFLKMCKEAEQEPVAVEALPDLPPFDFTNKERPKLNYERKVPLTIVRYVYHGEEHGECSSWHAECHVDPNGKTDDSCFRSVSRGYYFEHCLSNGGGLKILYDSENGRCYMYWNRR